VLGSKVGSSVNDIFIIGCGGFAKEVYFLIKEINEKSVNPVFNFKGFIGTTEHVAEIKIGGNTLPVLFEDNFLKTFSNKQISLAIGIGVPNIIEKLYSRFKDNFIFPNLIHPNFVGYLETIQLGVGNIITSGNNFTVDIKIGSLNVFNLNSTVGHDTIIGSFNVINPGSNISGNVKIGDSNLIGTNASILQNLELGSNSVLGAGSVLFKSLE